MEIEEITAHNGNNEIIFHDVGKAFVSLNSLLQIKFLSEFRKYTNF